MIKITYPGTNNFSTFVYDGLSRNVSIVETTAGSVTSTKQFVWCGDNRKEERDASGVLTKKFFGRGQMNSATKYFYDKDHLGSVREMNDNSGVIQAQYVFDPFGQVTKISEIVASDFGYAEYYLHSRSGLNLTRTRTYSSAQGRFITRDPIGEAGGLDLYDYVHNSPTSYTDPQGTSWQSALTEGYMDAMTIGPLEALQAGVSGALAQAAAAASGISGPHNGPQDAFRHCLWACTLTKMMGLQKGQMSLDDHEIAGGGPSNENIMDMANNAAGQAAAKCNGSCWDQCKKSLGAGGLTGLGGTPMKQ